MRITNQMLARTAQKSGIPLQQTSLLDIMNKKSASASDWASSLGNTKNTNSLLQNLSDKENKKLGEAAKNLSGYAAGLLGDGEDSLFAEAEKTGDTKELVDHISGMVDSYNKTIKQLKGSDSALNGFYLQELKNYAAENEDALKAAGITRNKDGSLSVDKDTLSAAGPDVLKAAFGGASGFTEKVGYVSGRVAENASAYSNSILSGYNSAGKEALSSYAKNMYNFWG